MLGTLSYLTDLFFIDEDYAPSYDDAEYIEQLTGPFEVTKMWLDQFTFLVRSLLSFRLLN